MLSKIIENYKSVVKKIDDENVKIVSVSKKQTYEKMNALTKYLETTGGYPIFGESYLQEYEIKLNSLIEPFQSHFIGRLQSNKIKNIVKLFDCIQSVSSSKHLALIDKEAKKIDKIQNVFLQINISKDDSKDGFSQDVINSNFLTNTLKYNNLKIAGLMTITEYYTNREDVRKDFKRMYAIWTGVKEILGSEIELSMGMSRDYDIAVQEGATVIRVGSLIFGERT